MSIKHHVLRISSAKADIRNAIEIMGVGVPISEKIDAYAAYILMIGTSGGGAGIQMTTDYSIAPTSVEASESVGGGSKSGGLVSMPAFLFGSYFDNEFVTDYGIA